MSLGNLNPQSELNMSHQVKIAVEGCGHGTLNAIYSAVEKSCEARGWDGVDLLIIGGDFQAVRNASDLDCMAVPVKYRQLGDFHEYYSGERKAPYLTLFVGGNHEASNHLYELYYGGWVAPNIYYLGAANVLRFGQLRIAGLSGIYKRHNYNQVHYERLPYNQDDIRSIYHVREFDTRKLLQLKTQVDIGLSHDWPQGIEWMGDTEELFKIKPYFRQDANTGNLGNPPARQVLEHLRPPYWFSAHLHVRYTATVTHKQLSNEQDQSNLVSDSPRTNNPDAVHVDLDDLDRDSNKKEAHNTTDVETSIPQNGIDTPGTSATTEPLNGIMNTTTKFLSLDKCLPKHEFLELLEIQPFSMPATTSAEDSSGRLRLEYDPEFLSIQRAFAFAHPLQGTLGTSPSTERPRDLGSEYLPLIKDARDWIEENVVAADKLQVPDNFVQTAPSTMGRAEGTQDESTDARLAALEPKGMQLTSIDVMTKPREYRNPQTQQYCELLGFENPFQISDEEIIKRIEEGPSPSERGDFDSRGRGRGDGFRGGRGGRGQRGFGRGRGRGHWRGRGRGRY